jgi:hypothetical protein
MGKTILFYALCVIITLLPFAPIIHFLWRGWKTRRDELLEKFTETTIQQYIKIFYPKSDIKTFDEFKKDYLFKYGRPQFLLPCILFGVTIGIVTWMVLDELLYAEGILHEFGSKYVIVFGAAGAYIWVCGDLITKSHQNDILTSDINRATLRFFISIPLAYALSLIVAENLKAPIALFLGAFPTDTLMKLMRRLASKTFDSIADAGGDNIQELLTIDGISVPIAERFVDEGIGTILQLAYCDPVALSIRAGKDFNFVLDCVSQALAAMNFRDQLGVARKFGLRGAQEVRALTEKLDSSTQEVKTGATAQITELAAQLTLSVETTTFILCQIVEDPYAVFTWNIWPDVK